MEEISLSISEGERIDRVNGELSLIQKTDGLTYGTDAYLLSAFIKPAPRGLAVELGAGSGIVSLLLATAHRARRIVAAEIQPAFAELIERNAALNRLSDTVIPLCADIRTLRPDEIGGEADLVFANPPYMKVNAGKRNVHEEKYQARHEVNGDIDDFCRAAYRLLKHGGRFYVVYRPDRLTDLIVALRANRLEPKEMVFVQANADTPPSMLLIEAKKGGSSGSIVHKTLILCREGSTELTDLAEEIYRTRTFPRQTAGGARRAKPSPAVKD